MRKWWKQNEWIKWIWESVKLWVTHEWVKEIFVYKNIPDFLNYIFVIYIYKLSGHFACMFFKFSDNFIYFVHARSLLLCRGCLVAVSGPPSNAVAASRTVGRGLWAALAVANVLSCSTARGSFPDQGSKPRPLGGRGLAGGFLSVVLTGKSP